MSKFKICPECGAKNPPDVSDCEKCDFDLMNVPVTDEQQLAAINAAQKTVVDKGNLFRICGECGEKNPPNARKCKSCGEDISDVIPTTDTAPEPEIKSAAFVLRSLDDKITLPLDREDIILGREHELKDYLTAKNFVSRRHCRLTIEDEKLFVEDLGSANGTYVNNEKISRKTKLSRGDEIGLGDEGRGSRQDKAAYFLVG